MATDTNDEVTGTNDEVVETATQPDLLWDDEARGLCLRVYGDGAKSFIFVIALADRAALTETTPESAAWT